MRTLNRLFARTLNFATRRRGDDRLHEELEQHLAMQTAENIRAGMSRDEAHRQAQLKFGGVESVRERSLQPATSAHQRPCSFADHDEFRTTSVLAYGDQIRNEKSASVPEF